MSQLFEQIISIFRSLPASRKVLMGSVLLMVVAGLSIMFLWANKIDFQSVFTNLSPEDASQIVERLKEQKIPYQLTGNGTGIMVPADKVYDVRLAMAGAGIPKGNSVGFEIFDNTNFGTTEFVQKLNYQRALQGELARTIKQFREVVDAKVMIVMPKDSVFIEDVKPPSASVLLKTRSNLARGKVAAVVHLVSSAVESLTPDRVTVVDTNGKVLSTGVPEQEAVDHLANKQLDYKLAFERNLAGRIQTMLERIVGEGKAIVRATVDMDFNQVDINEEIFDPEVQIVRSRQNTTESQDQKSAPAAAASSVNPVTNTSTAKETSDVSKRQDETVNYEINRTVRRIVRPVGSVKRLSVAAVLDGKHVTETGKDGNVARKYVARSPEELEQFKKIVQKAMGYDADREDQVSVESFPFSYMSDLEMTEPAGFDWSVFAKQHGRSLINIFLVLLVFLFIVRPLIKSVKTVRSEVGGQALLTAEEEKTLLEAPESGLLPEPEHSSNRSRAVHQAGQDVEKTATLVRTWVNEA